MKEVKFITYAKVDSEGKVVEVDLNRSCEVFESPVPEGQLNKWSLIKAVLFEKGFLWKLRETIKYALRWHDCYRGSGASDVILFTGTKSFDKLWK